MYLNKCQYSNQHNYTSNLLRTFILELVLYKTIMPIIIIDVFYHNPF